MDLFRCQQANADKMKTMPNPPRLRLILLWIWLASSLASCLVSGQPGALPQLDAAFSPTPSLTATQTPIPPTATLTPTSTPIPSQTATPEPEGCQKPPE